MNDSEEMMSVPIRTPEPEMEAHAYRRRFSTAYQRRMLAEADACTEPGAIGALLRRDGWYSSHLATWRAQRAAGARAALGQPTDHTPAPLHHSGTAAAPSYAGPSNTTRITYRLPAVSQTSTRL
jgi:hypothetical protein